MTRRDDDPWTPTAALSAVVPVARAHGLGASDAILRANPRYQLVLLERLAPDEREALLRDAQEADLYGILRPQPEVTLPPIAVSCDTALLFTSLREPGPLPRYALRRLGDDVQAALLPLVADGVLELLQGDAFVSGPAALARLQATRAPETRTRCAALSSEALERAAAMRHADVARLTEYLYRYNTRPRTPALQRAHRDAASVTSWLDVRGCSERAAARGFHAAGDAAWQIWARAAPSSRGQTYKLYVSAVPSDLPAVLRTTLDVVVASAAVQLKVGRTLGQVLRPDKLVVYFDGLAALQDAAARLGPRIAGAGAHGVPFTAPIDAAGLLSWGLDPPDRHVWTSSGGSFRLWMAQRLAAAITSAHVAHVAHGDAGAQAAEAAAFAVQRLQLDGVDTATWTPSLRLFGAGASAP